MGSLHERARRDPARLARRGLAALVLVVSGAVAWSLLKPAPSATPAATPAPAAPGTGTTVGELSFLRFRDDNRKVEVKAREMVHGQGDTVLLKGVEAALPFVREGRPGTATITAEECQYQAGIERAAFKGNVRLRTDDGFELESERLKYWADQQRVFTGDPVRFKRGAMSGAALGLEYRTGAGVLLKGAVRVRIEDAVEPVTIESDSATGSRETRVLTFTDHVVLRQGARELRGAELRLDLSADLGSVEHALATGGVDVAAGAGAALPGSPSPSAGARRLRSQRLEIGFREKGVLQQALATGSASLEVEPGPLEAQERRRVRAERLRFDFDDAGRLASVHAPPLAAGRSGARPRATLVAEPLAGSTAPARRVDSDGFDAQLEPATGELTGAEFDGSVVFEEPGRRAFAAHATSDQRSGTLVLTGEPRIVDDGDGSELRGRQIRLATRSRTLAASGNVRHSVAGKARSGRPGLFGGPEPTVFLCREFDFDSATRTARYRENAVVRSGQDELRAPLVTLIDPGAGERRMTATGGVVSVMHPRPAAGSAKEPAAVEARSREALYTEAGNRIVYTGEVEIRQGDILTRSPEAIVLLAADGATLDRLLAGTPVEVRQAERRATGERGTYTPANETFVLTGERVVLHDGDRRLEGRILTFVSGSDRIRVDGREEVRTEAVFRRKEPPQP